MIPDLTAYGQALDQAAQPAPDPWSPPPARTVVVDVTFQKQAGLEVKGHVAGGAAFAMDELDVLLVDPKVTQVVITFSKEG